MNKIIFVGGKGGVGKTTYSCALALKKSKKNKVLLVSTDPAHSIGDAFQVNIGKDIYTYSENLFFIEIDGEHESNKYIEKIENQCKSILSPIIMDEIRKQLNLAKVSPGTFEAAIFDKMIDIILSPKDFDYIIFDTAPTGHTLKLLAFPELLESWFDSLIKKREKILMLKNMIDNKKTLYAEDEMLTILKNRKYKSKKIKEIFSDKNSLSFNFVLNLDKLSIAETRRALDTLNNLNIYLDKLIINKNIIESKNIYFEERKILEEKELENIKKIFKNETLFFVPLFNSDGLDLLKKITEIL